MKATCSHKKQCFDVSEIIFKLKKGDFFWRGGGGLFNLENDLSDKNIIFMAFKIITIIILNVLRRICFILGKYKCSCNEELN